MNEEAFDLGVALGCVSNDVPLAAFTKLAAVADRMNQPDAASAKRLVIKAAHDVMTACGDGQSAPANHLAILHGTPGWSAHADEVYSTVVKSCAVVSLMEKRAFNDTIEGLGNVAKGIGYTGLMAGAGLGSLYWMLSRHASQDEADVEGKKQQLQYYKNLNHELNDSLRRKYRYTAAAA
jgi:hypothetical protein